jgi:putative tricarboxylic transport membrane protein
MLKTELLRSNQLSGGNLLYIIHRPAALAIIAMMVFSLAMTFIGKRRQARI